MATSYGTSPYHFYLPDYTDYADIRTALNNFYYGNTNTANGGTGSASQGIYGALYTLYSGNPTLTGTINLTNTTQSTSIATGSLIISGGVGITKNVFVGGTLNAYGVAVQGTTGVSTLTYSGTGAFAISVPSASGTIALTSNLSSYAPLAGATFTGALLNSNTTDSTTSTTGSIITSGGIGVAKAINAGTTITATGNIYGATFNNGYAKRETVYVTTTGGSTATFSVSSATFSVGGITFDATKLKGIIFKVLGAGGAGGGSANTASSASVGSGGNGGGYAEIFISRAALIAGTGSISYKVGVGGAGVSGSSGNNGGDSFVQPTTGTSFSVITGYGGKGGTVSTFSSFPSYETDNLTTGNFGLASGGSINIPGGIGTAGVAGGSAIRQSKSGVGGASVFGVSTPAVRAGGTASSAGSDGQSATGYGAGGSGSVSFATQLAATGGNGSDGLIIMEMFY